VTSIMKQRAAHEPLYDINPATGASFEVFYSDRTLVTFGRGGSGWFWWSRRRDFSPETVRPLVHLLRATQRIGTR
jgi:hypothetical protein